MRASRYNELLIRTPEGVEFVYQLASPVARCLALFVDIAVIWGTMSVLSIAVALMQWVSYDFAQAFYILLYFMLNIGYFILFEIVWRGQTIGKRMLRLRVMDANGLKMKGSQLIIRNLLRFVDSMPILYAVGGVSAALNSKSQRLGDLAAGTVVVRIPEIEAPALSTLDEKLFNSFREHPRIEALLRQKVPPEQAEIALQSLIRRGEMDAASRTRLYRELANSFRDAAVFPDEITRSLSDEQYVRNAVDSIYRYAKS